MRSALFGLSEKEKSVRLVPVTEYSLSDWVWASVQESQRRFFGLLRPAAADCRVSLWTSYEGIFLRIYRYLAVIDQILLAFRSAAILTQNFWVEGKPSFHSRPIMFEKFVLNLEVVLNPEVGNKNGRSNIGLIEISLNFGKPLYGEIHVEHKLPANWPGRAAFVTIINSD